MSKARTLANLISDNAELADGQISVAEVVGAAPTASPTFTGNIDAGDNVKIRLGDSDDLQIYHTGGQSIIDDVGTGQLTIRSNGTDIRLADSSNNRMLIAKVGAEVELYHNGSQKLETTATGVAVTGNATFADNGKAIFGASGDLEVFHDGSNSHIRDAGTGGLIIKGEDSVQIRTTTSNDAMLYLAQGGAVTAYHNGSAKLATTSAGIAVTGTSALGGDTTVTGILAVSRPTSGYGGVEVGGPSGGLIDLKAPFSDDYDARIIYNNANSLQIITLADEPILLRHANTTRLATSSTGIDVTGTATMDGLTVDGSGYVYINTNGAGANPSGDKGLFLNWNKSNSLGESTIGFNNQSGLAPYLQFASWDGTNFLRHMRIDDTGDISFYEDTGTTAKFFWDASAESLGLGTVSPSAPLQVVSTSGSLPALGAASSHAAIGSDGFGTMIGTKSTGAGYIQQQRFDGTATAYDLLLQPNGGNVGINTNSPIAKLQLNVDHTPAVPSDTAGAYTSDGVLVTYVGDNNDAYGGKAVGGIYSRWKDAATENWAGIEFTDKRTSSNSGHRSGIVFRTRDSGTGDRAVIAIKHTGTLFPYGDGVINLGTSSNKWGTVYAATASINTSDENEKQQIAELTSSELTAAKAISGLFRTFKFNDAVAKKGDSARTHSGVIAQQVHQVLTDNGLDSSDYAFFIRSVHYTKQETRTLSDGSTEELTHEWEYNEDDIPDDAIEHVTFGIRYAELLSFIGASTEQRFASIEASNIAMETRLTALEG